MQEVEAICQRTIIINRGVVVANATTGDMQKEVSNSQTVTVEFSAPVDREYLLYLPGVTNVVEMDKNKWLIYSGQGIDVRQALFQAAVRKDIAVLTMQQHEKSLEEVFHELTQENPK